MARCWQVQKSACRATPLVPHLGPRWARRGSTSIPPPAFGSGGPQLRVHRPSAPGCRILPHLVCNSLGQSLLPSSAVFLAAPGSSGASLGPRSCVHARPPPTILEPALRGAVAALRTCHGHARQQVRCCVQQPLRRGSCGVAERSFVVGAFAFALK